MGFHLGVGRLLEHVVRVPAMSCDTVWAIVSTVAPFVLGACLGFMLSEARH